LADRSYLSIGEVLSLLQDEFPDITISKIRFLESQGLVGPERTPSGYRKFYEEDIQRLRWVLRQQRDAFLPLKVIKGRLEGQGALAFEEPSELGRDAGGTSPESPAEDGPAGYPASGEEGPERGRASVVPSSQRARRGEAGRSESGGPGPKGMATRSGGGGAGGSRSGAPWATGMGVARGRGTGQAQLTAAAPAPEEAGAAREPAADGPKATKRHRSAKGTAQERDAAGAAGPGPSQARDELSTEELIEASGVSLETVRDLERYGLISPRFVAGVPYYSRDASVIAHLAGAFARHGVEARHLRAYKGAAEREAGLVQQVVMPLVRQRNPEARRAASRAVEELSALGAELRSVLLREALAELR